MGDSVGDPVGSLLGISVGDSAGNSVGDSLGDALSVSDPIGLTWADAGVEASNEAIRHSRIKKDAARKQKCR